MDFPADLTTVETRDELVELEQALVAEFDALHDAGDADLAALTEIAEQIEAVRAEVERRDVETAKAEAAIAELAARVHTAAEPEPETDPETDPDPEAATEPEPEPEPELVTASAPRPRPRPRASAVAARSPRPTVAPATPTVSLTAAADVPGYTAGAPIDLAGIAAAMHDRARALGVRSQRAPVARIGLPIPATDWTDGSVASTLDVLDRVAAPAALVAAGGWCAPSETLYELFSIESADNMLDLPTIGVTRGGINVSQFLGFGAADDGLWTWTEDDDIEALDGTPTKPCVRVPCPTFEEYRLEAEGLCVTHGNLTDRAYPELTTRFVSLAINGHLHRVSTVRVNKIVADALAVTVTGPSDAAGDLLAALDLQVADYKSQYAIANSAVLEVVFPAWVREAIRATLAMRAGVDLTNVTDAMIDAHFSTRKIRPQYVFGYQRLYAGTPASAWPSTVKFLLYPAGSYFAGTGGTIDLGVVRDSTLNATNDFTAAWTEQFHLVARRGPRAREVTVPLSVSGVTGCCPVE